MKQNVPVLFVQTDGTVLLAPPLSWQKQNDIFPQTFQ